MLQSDTVAAEIAYVAREWQILPSEAAGIPIRERAVMLATCRWMADAETAAIEAAKTG